MGMYSVGLRLKHSQWFVMPLLQWYNLVKTRFPDPIGGLYIS